MVVDGVEGTSKIRLVQEVVGDAEIAGADVVQEGLLQLEARRVCRDFALQVLSCACVLHRSR